MSDYISKRGEVIPQETRALISLRYHTITRAVNVEFRGSTSNTMNSLYVGSYGRGTAVDTSDIDILVEIPQDEYQRYDYLKKNQFGMQKPPCGTSCTLHRWSTVSPPD